MRREQIDAALAAELVAEQFPRWADLPVSPVAFSGSDNRTFRLGDTMTVRLPSATAYVGSVEKAEHAVERSARCKQFKAPEFVDQLMLAVDDDD